MSAVGDLHDDDINELHKQLEAANQRNLELEAVIERLADDWDDLLEDMELHGMHKFEPYIRSKAKFKNRPEPSQALREHEANVFEEAASHVELNGYYAVADELRRVAEERRKK